MGFNRILTVTDGSETALRGVSTAAELAASFATEMVLVAAVSVPELVALRVNVDRGALEEYVERAAQRSLETSIALLREARIGAEVKVVMGSMPDVILAEIEASGADLVVMGRRGRDEPKDLVLGSASDRVARHVKVPLLLVP